MENEAETHEKILIGGKDQEGEDLSPEAVLALANDAKKERWLSIFIALNNHHRFRKMLDNNYIIRDVINEEEKTIDTQVIEKPIAVGPPLTGKQIFKLRQVMQRRGIQDLDSAFNELMMVLGQEEGSSIILSSDVEAVATSQKNLKNKLDA